MEIIEREIKGVFELQPKVFGDDRGHFLEVFRLDEFNQYCPGFKVVQQNESRSKYGVVRGLHMQNAPFAQAKLIRVTQGIIKDIAVDVRVGSATYGQHVSLVLSEENKKQLYIPEGFAHGFSVLSESATIVYKINSYYHAESEASIHPLSKTLDLDWGIPQDDMIMSDKDLAATIFSDFSSPF